MSELSDAKARRLSPSSKPVLIGGVKGLYLHPKLKVGQGKWVLRYVSPTTKKRRDMGLGTYPEISVAAARKLGLEVRQTIAIGKDPIDQRKLGELEIIRLGNIPTFEAAANIVHQELSKGFRNPKHAAQWIITLQTYVFRELGSILVTDLRASNFADMLSSIWLTKPETASRIKQRCDKIMNWCVAKEYISASPVSAVDLLLPKQPGLRERVKHHPAVPWKELPRFVQRELYSRPNSVSARMLEFLILTAARSGEVRGMRWNEVDFDEATWTVPAERMKSKKEHVVPLSIRALGILVSQNTNQGPADLVFPSRKGTPLSDMAMTKLLRDAKTPSDVKGRIATAHGFRSTFRNWAAEHEYSREIAERALAHSIRSSSERPYYRTQLQELRQKMMQDWADFATGDG